MRSSSHWGKSPKQSVEQECERRGLDSVVKGCVHLLNGEPHTRDKPCDLAPDIRSALGIAMSC